MRRTISIIFFVALISFTFIFYLTNQEPKINFERFNLVSPGILRTPDERFVNLEDFPFKENYLTIGDTRIHYLDEGIEKWRGNLPPSWRGQLGAIYLEK